MLQIKIGIHLPSLRVPLPQALPLAAKLGADAVEIDAQLNLRPNELSQTALRQLRKTLEDYRLRVCAISFRTRRGMGDPEQLDARVMKTKEVMQMAHALGTSVVVINVGHIPAEPKGSQWNLLIEVLTDLGRHGHHVGALLAAQSAGASGADLARLIAALPDGSLGSRFRSRPPYRQWIRSVGSNQLTRTPRAARARHRRRARSARNRNIEVPLGRGSVDYPSLLAVLEQRGYRGYFTIERDSASPRRNRPGRAVPAKSVGYIDQ